VLPTRFFESQTFRAFMTLPSERTADFSVIASLAYGLAVTA